MARRRPDGSKPAYLAGAGLSLTERINSREWDERTGQATLALYFDLTGTSSELVARSFLMNETSVEAPGRSGLIRSGVTLEPVTVDEGSDTGHWFCTVLYASPELVRSPLANKAFSFDTTGGTQHITQSLVTVGAGARDKPDGSPGIPSNYRKAIQETDDRVEGTTIVSPVYHFSETHTFLKGFIGPAYKGILFRLTGKMNEGTFRGFARGECLFVGATGAQRGQGAWEVTFRFASSPNLTGLAIGDIPGIDKLGWDFLWVRYTDVVDESSGKLIKIPDEAYVERVYEFGDFGDLNIDI